MRILFLFLGVALMHGSPASPAAHAQVTELRFEHLSDVGPVVYAVHQDREGFLWLATWEGLYRYDGHVLKRYAHVPGDPTTPLGDNVRALYEDRQGTLWTANPRSGGPGGWNRYDRETDRFTRFPYEQPGVDATYSRRIGAMYQDPAGRYWTSLVQGGSGSSIPRRATTSGTTGRPEGWPP